MAYYGSDAMEMNGLINLEDAEFWINITSQNAVCLSQHTLLEMVLMDI